MAGGGDRFEIGMPHQPSGYDKDRRPSIKATSKITFALLMSAAINVSGLQMVTNGADAAEDYQRLREISEAKDHAKAFELCPCGFRLRLSDDED